MTGMGRIVVAAALVFCCCSKAAIADDERFAAAQALLVDGDAENALPLFAELHDEAPHNVDYVFAHGIALSRLGRDEEALNVLAVAIELAPQYEDVWRTRYNVLARGEDRAALTEFRDRASEQFPLASWWLAPPAEPRHPWVLTLGTGFDALDNGFPDWNNQFLELRYEHGESARYSATLARDVRNDASDTTVGVAAEWSLARWVVGAGLSRASSPAIMPETGVELLAGRTFSNGWGARLRYRQRDYANASVDSTIASVEKYVGSFRVAYDLAWSQLDSSSSFTSHVVATSWYFSDDASVGLSLGAGREAEAIGGGRVLETDIRTATLSGRYQFSQRVGASWWLGVHEQGDLYRRRFVGIAVSIRI